jgi:hypothetical protein
MRLYRNGLQNSIQLFQSLVQLKMLLKCFAANLLNTASSPLLYMMKIRVHEMCLCKALRTDFIHEIEICDGALCWHDRAPYENEIW